MTHPHFTFLRDERPQEAVLHAGKVCRKSQLSDQAATLPHKAQCYCSTVLLQHCVTATLCYYGCLHHVHVVVYIQTAITARMAQVQSPHCQTALTANCPCSAKTRSAFSALTKIGDFHDVGKGKSEKCRDSQLEDQLQLAVGI